MYQTKQKEHAHAPARAAPMRKQMRARLHGMVGTPDPLHSEKDPVWCATDVFSTAFEHSGAALSQQAAPTGCTLSEEQRRRGVFLQRFGGLAFQRGELAASIVRGEGTMMLVSCLKRAYRDAGAQSPKTRINAASARRTALRGGAQVIFNPGDIQTAVGLVTQSLHSARQQLIALERAALAHGAPETLLRDYPFLCVEQEKASLAQYLQRLREPEGTDDPETLAVLRYGVDRLNAILQKKEQQRQVFLTRLEELLQCARTAEREYREEDFVRRVTAASSDFTDGEDAGDTPDTPEQTKQQVADPQTTEQGGTMRSYIRISSDFTFGLNCCTYKIVW